RVRRLPGDPAADDQPPARVRRAHLRRPPARGDAHRPPGGDRGGGDRAGAAGPGLRLWRVQPRTRGACQGPGNQAAGTAACRRVAGKRLRLPGRDLTARPPAGRREESSQLMFGVQGRVVAAITLRATMGRRRAFLFALPPLVLILVTAGLKLAHPERASWPSDILGVFGFSVVL